MSYSLYLRQHQYSNDMKKIFLVIMGLSLLLTSCTNLRKYTNYRSQDSLFTIDIPESYTIQKEGSNMVAWSDNNNFIYIRKDFVTGKTAFISFADNNTREGLPSRFSVELADDSNDSIRHYTIHTMTYYQRIFYFLNTFIING
jgi:hypothetical protein